VIRRHTLTPTDNRRLAHVCGPLDAHLRRIETTLGVALQRREAQFRVEGPRAAVDRSTALLDQMHALAAAPISEHTLQLMLVQALGGSAATVPATPPSRYPSHPLLDDPQTPVAPASSVNDVVLHTRHAGLAGRTPNQMQYLRHMLGHDISFGIGPAGTGKTFLAVACAVDALERRSVERIVLTRPAVEAGERLGFLPGDLAQKVDPYLRPLYDALYDLMGTDRVTRAFEKGLIEVAPLAFMRGRTLNHAFVILDEAQNATCEQMKMFLTRIGFGSRCVVTGDVSQIDLPAGTTSGLVHAQAVLAGVNGIVFTTFTAADVVRHPLVARIVQAYEANDAVARASKPSTKARAW
jgi:phosphate starvation-inducible protein PhoH and related proteins